MRKKPENVQASLLDRLIDEEPGLSRESAQFRLTSVSQVKAFVIRDLENLLNTKRQIWQAPASHTELNDSVFVYGLQDFTSHNPKSPTVRQRLRQDIERAISRFEPRLKNLTVQFEMPTSTERNLRFRITAMLIVEPIAEPVVFDTYFDVDRGEYVISG